MVPEEVTGLAMPDAAMSEKDGGIRFMTKKIRDNITYYYVPCPKEGHQAPSPAPDSLLGDSASPASPDSRPLLLFFPWLGARPDGMAKYRDLYLERGVDVLLVQSGVLHFLWPRWGLEYGLEVLQILEEEPEFAGRPVLVHSASIGGYTFTQILTHVAQGRKQHVELAQRVIGHIYDSLVVGTLEQMARSLGRTLVPRFQGLVKNAAMFYFWLFKSSTVDLYDRGIQVFLNHPISAPALFFFSENDALSDAAVMEDYIGRLRKRGMAVESRKWKVSTHAAHMRCHPRDYLSTLDGFLRSLPTPALKLEV